MCSLACHFLHLIYLFGSWCENLLCPTRSWSGPRYRKAGAGNWPKQASSEEPLSSYMGFPKASTRVPLSTSVLYLNVAWRYTHAPASTRSSFNDTNLFDLAMLFQFFSPFLCSHIYSFLYFFSLWFCFINQSTCKSLGTVSGKLIDFAPILRKIIKPVPLWW